MRSLRELEVDALTAQKLEKWSIALEIWKEILLNQPDWESGYGYYNLADCYTRLGQIDAAEAAYRKAISIAPEDSLFSDTLRSLMEARNLGHI